MKIIILHGDNIADISGRLTKFIDVAHKRSWKIVRLNNPDGNFNFKESLTGNTLFSEKRLYIIDDLRKIKKSDLEWLKKYSKNLEDTLIVVNNGVLTKTSINLLPLAYKIELFELPKKIWLFLDSIYPGMGRVSLVLLHEVLEMEAIELVYALLARQLKDLYMTKCDPESINYPGWRTKKLNERAQKYPSGLLEKVISDLSEADYKAKTGQADLTTELDLIIATRLE